MPKTHKSHMWPNSLKIQNNSDIFGIEKVGGEVICKQITTVINLLWEEEDANYQLSFKHK